MLIDSRNATPNLGSTITSNYNTWPVSSVV